MPNRLGSYSIRTSVVNAEVVSKALESSEVSVSLETIGDVVRVFLEFSPHSPSAVNAVHRALAGIEDREQLAYFCVSRTEALLLRRLRHNPEESLTKIVERLSSELDCVDIMPVGNAVRVKHVGEDEYMTFITL